jgi:hypothetical protein
MTRRRSTVIEEPRCSVCNRSPLRAPVYAERRGKVYCSDCFGRLEIKLPPWKEAL